MTVTLEIPDHIRFQMVYRLQKGDPYPVAPEAGYEFHFLGSAREGVAKFGLISGYSGRAGALKTMAKLATPSRSMYLLSLSGRVVSVGWTTLGQCRYYKVEKESVVIGPIWTSDEVRGKGLATLALKLAINEHIRRGRSLFYIDTEKVNTSAQRVFEKCGFGQPAALYFR